MLDFTFTPQMIVWCQLILLEMIFLWKAERRRYFLLRAAGSFIAGLLIAWVYMLIPVLTSQIIKEITSYFIIYFLTAIFVLAVYKLSPVSAIFISSCTYAIQHISFCLDKLLIGGGVPEAFYGYIRIFSPLVVGCIFYLVILRKNEHVYKSADFRQVVVALVLLFVCIALNSMRIEETRGMVYVDLYDAILCVSCLVIQFSISNSEKLHEENKTLELIINRQHDQHKLSQQAFEMLHIKIHNIRHQLSSMQQILDEKDNAQIRSCMRTLQIYDTVANTGSATLDAVLMEKGLMCEINNIRFSFIADGRQLSFMEAADLFSLVNNILDNAIESELKEDDEERRIINLRIVRSHDMFLNDTTNYCRYPVVFEDNKIQTTKVDKENHGMGMRGIEYVVNKYGGEMTLSQKDDLFCVGIVLPVPNA